MQIPIGIAYEKKFLKNQTTHILEYIQIPKGKVYIIIHFILYVYTQNTLCIVRTYQEKNTLFISRFPIPLKIYTFNLTSPRTFKVNERGKQEKYVPMARGSFRVNLVWWICSKLFLNRVDSELRTQRQQVSNICLRNGLC